MKRLFLLRHAKSSWDDPTLEDFDRPLTARGERACQTMRQIMAKRGIAPQAILCSAARRAQDTLSGLWPDPPAGSTVKVEKQLYLADATKLLRRLQRLDDKIESVLLIGHNPGLQQLALGLSNAGKETAVARLKAKFPTAALAEIAHASPRWADLGGKTTRLVCLTTPKDADGKKH